MFGPHWHASSILEDGSLCARSVTQRSSFFPGNRKWVMVWCIRHGGDRGDGDGDAVRLRDGSGGDRALSITIIVRGLYTFYCRTVHNHKFHTNSKYYGGP